MIREAFDDFCRFLRDREVNNQKYKKLTLTGVVSVESAKIKVGDLIIVEKVRRSVFSVWTAVLKRFDSRLLVVGLWTEQLKKLHIDFHKILGINRIWTGEELTEFWKIRVRVSIPAGRQWSSVKILFMVEVCTLSIFMEF